MVGVFAECAHESRPDDRGDRIGNPRLNDARSACMGHRQDAAKVEIMSEHDQTCLACVVHDRLIVRPRITDRGPVHALDAPLRKKVNPARGEVHVDQKPYFDDSGTSNSSARHAA
jgi:hypothetical protein